MKKWMMPIGLIVAICILTASVAMPICLADQNRIEIEGALETHHEISVPINVDEYKIEELNKGDKIKVVISGIRGDGNIYVSLTNTSTYRQKERMYFLYGPLLQATAPAICLYPCFLCVCSCYHLTPKLIAPIIGETIFTFEGEEKTFTVPKDGVYYLCMEAEEGDVVYKGYIEVIKTEK